MTLLPGLTDAEYMAESERRLAARGTVPPIVRGAAQPPVSAIKRSVAVPSVYLTLPEPPSANRWWRNVGGRMVLSKAAKEYKAHVALLAAGSVPDPLEGPIALSVTWYRGRKSGDLDKRLGVLLDGLQGVCYANDSQIVEIHAFRSDLTPDKPRVEVCISRVG